MGIQGDHSQDTVTFPTVTALLHMLSVAHIMALCVYYSVICSGLMLTSSKLNGYKVYKQCHLQSTKKNET